MQSPSSLPDYENPPVIEVVFGIHFEPLQNLKAPHTGLFWDRLNRGEYPECEEQPPIGFVLEVFGETPPVRTVSIEQLSHPPLPRLFFINRVRNHLVQVQQDGFLQNWRKLDAETKYPRYKELFPKFLESWRSFSTFVQDENIGELKIKQYELTYLNHILRGEGWISPKDVGNVFRDFCCTGENRFLSEPESVSWRTTYRLPDNKGRLHVRMNQAVSRQNREQVFVLDLTARGITDEGMQAWFNTAHEWIVRGFEDLTTPETQAKIWKKK